jgi:hypothetical protein
MSLWPFLVIVCITEVVGEMVCALSWGSDLIIGGRSSFEAFLAVKQFFHSDDRQVCLSLPQGYTPWPTPTRKNFTEFGNSDSKFTVNTN